MATISGTLKNASGVRPNTKIILTAYKTTSAVVTLAPDTAIITDANGAYSFVCNSSCYNVRIQQPGHPCENVGTIQVYSDSVDGDLNQYLTNFNPDHLTPEIEREMRRLALEAAQSASAALTSQTKTKASEVNAKDSETKSLSYKNESEAYKNRVESLSADVTIKHADTVVKAKEAADSAALASQVSGLDTVDDAINMIITPLNAAMTSAIISNQTIIIKAHPLY